MHCTLGDNFASAGIAENTLTTVQQRHKIVIATSPSIWPDTSQCTMAPALRGMYFLCSSRRRCFDGWKSSWLHLFLGQCIPAVFERGC